MWFWKRKNYPSERTSRQLPNQFCVTIGKSLGGCIGEGTRDEKKLGNSPAFSDVFT